MFKSVQKIFYTSQSWWCYTTNSIILNKTITFKPFQKHVRKNHTFLSFFTFVILLELKFASNTTRCSEIATILEGLIEKFNILRRQKMYIKHTLGLFRFSLMLECCPNLKSIIVNDKSQIVSIYNALSLVQNSNTKLYLLYRNRAIFDKCMTFCCHLQFLWFGGKMVNLSHMLDLTSVFHSLVISSNMLDLTCLVHALSWSSLVESWQQLTVEESK